MKNKVNNNIFYLLLLIALAGCGIEENIRCREGYIPTKHRMCYDEKAEFNLEYIETATDHFLSYMKKEKVRVDVEALYVTQKQGDGTRFGSITGTTIVIYDRVLHKEPECLINRTYQHELLHHAIRTKSTSFRKDCEDSHCRLLNGVRVFGMGLSWENYLGKKLSKQLGMEHVELCNNDRLFR